MSDGKTVTAAILVIGDEILSGRTKDRNIGHIADHLTSIGIALSEVRVVADREEAIIEAVNALRARFTYLFTTGGIGPTHDDITADSVAKALGLPLAVDPRALALMRPFYEARGIELNAARLRMARVPQGATLVRNPLTAAPGFMVENVIVMAGIPEVMAAMLRDVTPLLATGPRVLSATLRVDRPEGEIADLFASHQREHPQVVMGSYPTIQDGRFGAELVLRATDERMLADALKLLQDKLRHS